MPAFSFSGLILDSFEPVDAPNQLQDGVDALVPFDMLAESFDVLQRHGGRLGVCIPGDLAYQRLAPMRDRLSLIAIDFPVFSDGRGFSLAVRLRKDLDYNKALIACGPILPDQAVYLLRAGFDGAIMAEDRRAAFERALTRYGAFYQYSYNGDLPLAHYRPSSPETLGEALGETLGGAAA